MKTFDILLKPVVTEKVTSGEKEGKYQFFVRQDATKVDIKDAFSKLYGVAVVKVNIIKTAGKKKMSGRHEVTKKPEAKKAIITTKGKKTLDVLKLKLKI